MTEPMKILWHSNAPFVRSGYGTQTRLFVPRLQALGHDISISAYWGLNGAVWAWEGITVFPGDEVWGNRLLPALAQQQQPDAVITLLDVWVLEHAKVRELPLACWVPVDHEPCPPNVVEFFRKTGAVPIAMSRFGERMLQAENLDPLYIPHGVDTRVYRPRPPMAGRERLGIPQDAFLIGMVAANKGNNPPRKGFPQVLQAFAQIRREIPAAYLYIHCDPVGRNGVHLAKLADQLGIAEDAIRCPPTLQLDLGVPDETMAEIFSCFDVLANPSYGEGFGVPIVEAQACGTPVVVTNGTSMPELLGAGWLVDGEPWFDVAQRSFYTIPSVAGIAQAFREAYEQRGDVSLANRARSFACQYDAGIVVRDYWRPALAEIAGRLTAPAVKQPVAA
jgi:glycosyltransferase involved in cell wall biosynthesis